MKFETLKTIKNKKIVIEMIIAVVLGLAIIIGTSLAKYRVTESIQLVKGTINYSPGDIIITAYFNGEKLATFPSSEDGYTAESVTCDKDASATWDEQQWGLNVTNFTQKGTKCDIYFVEKVLSSETILAGKTISTRTDFSTIYTADTTGTIYSAADDDGTSYYFAGAPADNWVKFSGFYWRIIRINGDGTLRLIYNGTTTTTIGNTTQIGTSSFNANNNNNMYVGYMYTSGNVHGLGTSSTIKGIIDDWYNSNLKNYSKYISDDAGFCGDRQPSTITSSINGEGGTGLTATYYAGHIRLYNNKTPDLKCAESNDLYTTNISTKGNKALTYPIGLITADELSFAGGVHAITNTSYYLYTGQNYWSITPYGSNSFGYAGVFSVVDDGRLYGDFIANSVYGVRPVINLRADVTLTGSGTSTDPYEVEGAE